MSERDEYAALLSGEMCSEEWVRRLRERIAASVCVIEAREPSVPFQPTTTEVHSSLPIRSSLARMSAIETLRDRLDAICMEHGSTATIRIESHTESAWSAEVIVTADNQPGLIDVSYRIEAGGGQTPEEVATAAVENAILWVTERRAGP